MSNNKDITGNRRNTGSNTGGNREGNSGDQIVRKNFSKKSKNSDEPIYSTRRGYEKK